MQGNHLNQLGLYCAGIGKPVTQGFDIGELAGNAVHQIEHFLLALLAHAEFLGNVCDTALDTFLGLRFRQFGLNVRFGHGDIISGHPSGDLRHQAILGPLKVLFLDRPAGGTVQQLPRDGVAGPDILDVVQALANRVEQLPVLGILVDAEFRTQGFERDRRFKVPDFHTQSRNPVLARQHEMRAIDLEYSMLEGEVRGARPLLQQPSFLLQITGSRSQDQTTGPKAGSLPMMLSYARRLNELLTSLTFQSNVCLQ